MDKLTLLEELASVEQRLHTAREQTPRIIAATMAAYVAVVKRIADVTSRDLRLACMERSRGSLDARQALPERTRSVTRRYRDRFVTALRRHYDEEIRLIERIRQLTDFHATAGALLSQCEQTRHFLIQAEESTLSNNTLLY